MGVTKADVEAFLHQELFPDQRRSPATKASAAHLRLHPGRVDARLPGVHAHSAAEVRAALAAYRLLQPAGVALEVHDVAIAGDKALVCGEQVLGSRLAEAADALAARLPAWLTVAAADALPVPAEARVPTGVALTFGRNDAGDHVVTGLTIAFSLPAALLPHFRLPPWARRLAKRAGDGALAGLAAAGFAAAVAEDAWTAAAASYRASSAVGGTAIAAAAEPAAEALKRAGSAAAAAVAARLEAEGWWPPAAWLGLKNGGGGSSGGQQSASGAAATAAGAAEKSTPSAAGAASHVVLE